MISQLVFVWTGFFFFNLLLKKEKSKENMQKYLAQLQKFVNIYCCKMKIKLIQSFVERIGARVDVEVSPMHSSHCHQ